MTRAERIERALREVILSQTTTENPGAVHGLVAERLAAEDEARKRELDRLCGITRKTTEEAPMAEKKARACCGSLGNRHLAGCKESGKAGRLEKLKAAGETKASKAETKAARRETPRLVRVADSKLFDAAEATVEQLVETIQACHAELAQREELVARQLAAIRIWPTR